METTTQVTGVQIQHLVPGRIASQIGYGLKLAQSSLHIGDVSLIVGGAHVTRGELEKEAAALRALATEARRLSVWCEDRAETLRREQSVAAAS